MSNHPIQNTNKTNPARLLTEKQAAELLNLTPRALQGWRVQGRGPVFYKISGRAIRYSLADIERWLADQVRRSTSDPGPQGNNRTPSPEGSRDPF